MFSYFAIYQKFKGGDPYKMSNINVVQSCWNFIQLKEVKNKLVAKIIWLKKQKFGTTFTFPECLEHSPFTNKRSR